ncbi:MAG: tRNA (cytidine(34)-2'-O)-methyltransferase [Spirochaetales bacterium]|jgi:tRNA (cytidine/uridine-2'-O-)-methyltransferase|nr:tRNA (cytidine(34)-2'-O)-methyltransferase [Spirochaetales bacterium]
MLHIVLYEPQIPQNTGNIARTCAALGAGLHLIEPLGFHLDDSRMKRAGLDYWPQVAMEVHSSLQALLLAQPLAEANSYYLSSHAAQNYTQVDYPPETYFFFGRETTGLPENLLTANPSRCIRIPMRSGARSLNLSNAAAIIAYDFARRHNFPGCV